MGSRLSSRLQQDPWSCPSNALEEEEPDQAAFQVTLKEGYGSGQAKFDSEAETLQSLDAKVQQCRIVPGRMTAAG